MFEDQILLASNLFSQIFKQNKSIDSSNNFS